MQYLENDKLKIQVKELGAELCSIYSKTLDKEFMWQPGLEIWDHSSLILFPNPGRISRDRTIIGGKEYPATMHGFAWRRQFTVIENTGDMLVMELHSDEATRQSFPYEFTLRISFVLNDDKMIQKMDVVNKDEKTMYFCLGAHPGFYFPIILGETGDDYIIRFDREQNISRLLTQRGTMLLTGERVPYLTGCKDIQLSENYFDLGSHLLEGVDADTVTLLSKKSGHFVEMGIVGFPYMCLWGNAYKNAMICIEPWCGTSDMMNTDHVWETKLGIEHADAKTTFSRELSFRVGKMYKEKYK